MEIYFLKFGILKIEAMKFPTSKLSFIIAFSAIIFLSCEKENQVIPDGTQVVQTSEDEENGIAGAMTKKKPTAIVVSGSFTLQNEDYENTYFSLTTGPASAFGISAKVATKEIPEITEKVFDEGLILVYLKVPVGLTTTASQWAQVPYELLSFSGDYMINIASAYEIGILRIHYFYERVKDGVTIPNVFSETVPAYDFKYVIVYDASNSSGARMQFPDIDYSDYQQVKEYFGLEE